MRFAAIYSNPPVRVGKARAARAAASVAGTPAPGGRAYLVVQRNLGADSLATWLRAQGYDVQRLKSKKGYRVLGVATPK